MRTSAETLKYGLAQNKFPFGEAVVSPQGTYTFYIYERLFMQWIRERKEIPETYIRTGTIHLDGKPEFSNCPEGETLI